MFNLNDIKGYWDISYGYDFNDKMEKYYQKKTDGFKVL